MARKRDPRRDEAFELYKQNDGQIANRKIAELLNVPEKTISGWKSKDKWTSQLNGVLQKNERSTPKNKGSTSKKKKPKVVIDNDELTESQKLFCLYYLQYFNATKAYQLAYGVDYKTANTAGPRLMVNVRIKEELHRLKAELQQDIFVDVKDLIAEYIKQFGADITDIVEVNLTEYEVRDKHGNPVKTKKGEQVIGRLNDVYVRSSEDFDGSLVKKISQGKDGISVEMYDKHKAMSELMKYLGGDALREAQLNKLTGNDGATDDQEAWKKSVIEAANKRAVQANE